MAGWTVTDYSSRRQPFSPHPACPACETGHKAPAEFDVQYLTIGYLRGHNDERIDVTRFGDEEVDPHLMIVCRKCAFWWEMDVSQC